MKPVLASLVLASAALAASPQEPGPEAADEPAAERPLGDIPIEELSGEERAAAEAELHAKLEEEYFHAVDLDGGGWISYREGEAQLRMDRPEFFQFDADRDGRITREEFGQRYDKTVLATGSFRPPTSSKALFDEPGETAFAFDANLSQALEEDEVRAFLADRGIDLPANALFGLLDADGSGALEALEVEGILATLGPLAPDVLPALTGVAPPIEPASARTVRELFGRRLPREGTLGNLSPLADLVPGPLEPFERLDYDGDGFVEEADLLVLLRPARVEVRATAVIAGLDRDGDGRLSRAEILAAFGAR